MEKGLNCSMVCTFDFSENLFLTLFFVGASIIKESTSVGREIWVFLACDESDGNFELASAKNDDFWQIRDSGKLLLVNRKRNVRWREDEKSGGILTKFVEIFRFRLDLTGAFDDDAAAGAVDEHPVWLERWKEKDWNLLLYVGIINITTESNRRPSSDNLQWTSHTELSISFSSHIQTFQSRFRTHEVNNFIVSRDANEVNGCGSCLPYVRHTHKDRRICAASRDLCGQQQQKRLPGWFKAERWRMWRREHIHIWSLSTSVHISVSARNFTYHAGSDACVCMRWLCPHWDEVKWNEK